ncbi:MAG: glycosyltransferase [Thermoprotei archaeon]|jgi:hypothetical protein
MILHEDKKSIIKNHATSQVHENIRILVLIPTLKEIPSRLVLKLYRQSLKPSQIIIIASSKKLCNIITNEVMLPDVRCIEVKPNMREHVGIRVGKAINEAFQQLNINDYDYIIKADADIDISYKFLETCIGLDADLIGTGPFMVIRKEPFLKLCNGRYPETPADDTYLILRFQSAGLKVARWPQGIKITRKGGTFGNWRYYFLRGMDYFKIGIDPIHVIRGAFHLIKNRHTLLPIFDLVGYFLAMIKMENRYKFSNDVFHFLVMNFLRNIIGKIVSVVDRI